MHTKITIIVVTYNPGDKLRTAINSVVHQSYTAHELIIIDGGSTDGTIELLQNFEYNSLQWISEPDSGIYDAMNKAISIAKGEWIYFLGADDQLENSVLDRIQQHLNPAHLVVFGKVIFQNGSAMQSSLSARTILQNTVHHQSAFYHRSLFKNFRYDTSFKAIADYELNLKIWLERLPFKQIDEVVAHCYADGTSSNFELSLRETNAVRNKLIRNPLLQTGLSWLLRFYYYQKRVRGVSLSGVSMNRRKVL